MSEETKNTGTEKKTTRSCCLSGTLQDFFRKMGPVCPGLSDMPDCKAMMKDMKEKFRGQESEGNKTGCGN